MITAVLIAGFHIVGIVFALRAVNTARTSQGAMGWVLFLLFVPYIAVPFFIFLGHSHYAGYNPLRRSSPRTVRRLREFRQAHPAKFSEQSEAPDNHTAAFERLAEMQAVSGNTVHLLIDGQATFAAIFEAIDNAESYILIMTYIIRDDQLGRELKEKMIARARDGCAVRLIYDALGSHGLPVAFLEELRASGVEVTNFHSIRRAHSRLQLNFRNHRKIIVIDGETAFVGGHNIGDDYLGRSAYFGHWRDTHLRLQGPIVAQVQLIFAEDWQWATEERPELHWNPAAAENDLDALVLATGPADPMETGSLYFCNAINAAKNAFGYARPTLCQTLTYWLR